MVFLPRGREERRRRLAVLVRPRLASATTSPGVPRRLAFALSQRGLHGDVDQHADGQLRRHLRRRADASHPARHRRGARRPAPARLPPHRAARLQHGGDDGHPLPGAAAAGTTWWASAPWRTRRRCPRRCACGGTISAPTPATRRWSSAPTCAWRPTTSRRSSDRIFIVRRARGFGDGPLDGEIWTYRTWWFSRGPRAPHAESRLRVGRGHGAARPDPGRRRRARARTSEGGELEALARQGDCPGVLLHTVPGADHVFTGFDAEMTDAVISWLDQRV